MRQSASWKTFWIEQADAFDDIMELNTTFFANQITARFDFQGKRTLFDYGCGPGLLADYFVNTNVSVHGVDINAEFVKRCQRNHPTSTFIMIDSDSHRLAASMNQNFSHHQFDFIVLLSVTQYFASVSEVAAVVKTLKPFLKTEGIIILADVLHDNTSPLRDFLSVMKASIRKKKFVSFIKFMWHLIMSEYRTLSYRHKLLKLSDQEIKAMANEAGMIAGRIDGLTIQASRTSYVLNNPTSERYL